MTPQEINVAIAEAYGYRRSTYAEEGRPGIGHYTVWVHPSGKIVDDLSEYGDHSAIPNFYGDLNACHEMEKVFDGTDLKFEYSRNIYNVVVPLKFQPFRATAPQRCEAFLRTIGKWK